MHLDLLIPDLLPPAWPGCRAQEQGLKLPSLEWLLGRGNIKTHADTCVEYWLCRAHGLVGCPGAPYSLLAEGIDPGNDLWLYADPVHLQLNMDRLRLLDIQTFELNIDECAAFVEELNQLIKPVGMLALATRPHCWFLRIDESLYLEMLPLSLMAGEDLDPRSISGKVPAVWQKLLNEIQIAFHHLPTNESREAKGALTVSGIWPWGCGRLEQTEKKYSSVYADNGLARGLGIASGVPVHATPSRLEEINKGGSSLVVLEQLSSPARYGDIDAWHLAIQSLENDWLAPLAVKLRRGLIESARLVTTGKTGGITVTLKASDRWKFWLRPRKPSEILS